MGDILDVNFRCYLMLDVILDVNIKFHVMLDVILDVNFRCYGRCYLRC